MDPTNTYGQHTFEYLSLCFIAIGAAMAIAIPLGFSLARRPLLSFIVTNITGMMRAIPIIVFLAVAITIPWLGIGFRPSLIALTVLGVPPILLNTIAGIRNIDSAVIDAARGMGMTGRQIVFNIERPLALPIIIAGIRTSAVQIVATATISGLIGGGGYGDYILQGFYQFDTTQLLVGAVSVAIIAIAVEYGLGFLQRIVTPQGVTIIATSSESTSLVGAAT